MSMTVNAEGQPIGEPLPDWTVRPRPPRTPMRGRRCRIEPLCVDVHARDLFQAFTENGREPLWTYLPYGPFKELPEFQGWMERSCLGDDPLFHAIVDAQSGKSVGFVAFSRITPAVGVIELSHVVFAPSLQKTPMATEAVYLMLCRAFDELGYRRCEWKCDSLNAPSRRAAERLGFTFEGLFRKAIVYKQRSRDTAWYAIVDSDWPALKAAFEAWLSPENFNENGAQRVSLAAIRAGG